MSKVITLFNRPPCLSNYNRWERLEPALKSERGLQSGTKERGNKALPQTVQCGDFQSKVVLGLGPGMVGLGDSPQQLCQQRGNAGSPGGCCSGQERDPP